MLPHTADLPGGIPAIFPGTWREIGPNALSYEARQVVEGGGYGMRQNLVFRLVSATERARFPDQWRGIVTCFIADLPQNPEKVDGLDQPAYRFVGVHSSS